MQLSNARAVITGGVSGLGLAVAQHLVAQGGKVALFGFFIGPSGGRRKEWRGRF